MRDANAFGNALGQGLVDSMHGVDWSSAPDQSDAETTRLNRYAAAGSGSVEPSRDWFAGSSLRLGESGRGPGLGTGSIEPDPTPDELQAAFRRSERDYRSRTERSVAGSGYVARDGDSISRMVGSSDPQAIGNFMRANGLTSSNVEAGRNYFRPDEVTAYGDSAALGQAVLNGDNARLAALAQQRAAQQQAHWDSLRVGAWSGRTNQVVAPAAAATMEVPQYDAMGNYTGASTVVSAAPNSMGYGEQMRNVGRFSGDLVIGAVKGLDNLIPETAAFAYRMTGYAAAGVASLFDTDVSDRMFAQYSRVTGRVFEYDNSVQEFGGIAAQLAAPTLVKGVSASGSALYELELRAKTSFNYDYRHYFSGTTVLDAETTFYSYKNSAYFTPGTTFEPTKLWLTPELMTSQEAVQRLALPRPTDYDTLLTVTLPQGTSIMTPRPVWSLFGRPGGGVETRVYAPVTSDMYLVSPAPTKVPK